MAFLQGPGTAWFDDLRLTVAAASPAALEAASRPATVRLPLPQAMSTQHPFDLTLDVTPSDRLLGTQVLDDRGNPRLEVRLARGEQPYQAQLRWNSLVLLPLNRPPVAAWDVSLPDADSLPAEVRPYLQASATIQSGDPEIVEVAETFPADTCVGVLREVLAWLAGEVPARLGSWQEARSVLKDGGDESGQAHLAVALLRAVGVLARTASVVTVGEEQEPSLFLQIYLPEHGWETLPVTADGADTAPPAPLLLAVTHPAQEVDAPWGLPRGGQPVAGPEHGAGWLQGRVRAQGTVLLSPGAEPFRPDDLAALWAAALAQPLAARRPAEWNAAWPRAALAEDWAAFGPAIREARAAAGAAGKPQSEGPGRDK
jgi:hypothetical protein